MGVAGSWLISACVSLWSSVAAQLASRLSFVGVGRPGFGAVDDQGQTGVGGQLHGLEGEVEITDDRVMEVLATGAVEAHVVGGPPAC